MNNIITICVNFALCTDEKVPIINNVFTYTFSLSQPADYYHT